MTFHFRPPVLDGTPLIVGIAGPTKSGKTYSAMRIATGLANGGVIAMLNAEGARGHQYASKFKYVAADIDPPFSPKRYTEALQEVAKLKPSVLIIDSGSHMHDGPGGMLEWHDEIANRMAKGDAAKRERVNMAAWIEPKAAENEFIYTMLGLKCHVIICFRAKEKLKIVTGRPPVDLGWQPIASDRVAFETIFTLMLEPHSKGKPTRELSELREPFDDIVSFNKPLDEDLGRRLAEWSSGGQSKAAAQVGQPSEAPDQATPERADGPAAAAPGPEALEKFLNGEIDVDAATGEVLTKPVGRSFKFVLPGGDPSTFSSADDWFAEWSKWCAAIESSTKISLSAKEAKIRALKKANDEHIKTIGGMFGARIQADIATRIGKLKEEVKE